ncbi:hypothetical protein AVEN_71635-1 [Araneus ventricosus]|uniref:Uncharacterized protein n=1 Tax=Araneus ventricosus TaxID=182803 RepID=A0A4Y2KIH3_ARAVE|nr:hypothetical protein AVEN_71635-1 [Araneus ventricosus]
MLTVEFQPLFPLPLCFQFLIYGSDISSPALPNHSPAEITLRLTGGNGSDKTQKMDMNLSRWNGCLQLSVALRRQMTNVVKFRQPSA